MTMIEGVAAEREEGGREQNETGGGGGGGKWLSFQDLKGVKKRGNVSFMSRNEWKVPFRSVRKNLRNHCYESSMLTMAS